MSTRERIPLPPFPTGWYALGFVWDFPRGATAGTWLGRRLTVTRGADVVVTDDTGAQWAAREHHDAVMVWHDPAGGPPAWDLPDADRDGWTAYDGYCFEGLRTHPQETAENSVDTAHFGRVHRYAEVETLEEAAAEGPILRARYAFTRRPLPLLGAAPIRAVFTVRVVGLGWSFVENFVAKYGMHTRQIVLATPIDGERTALRIMASVRHLPFPGGRLAAWALRRVLMFAFVREVGDDVAIWENKRYLARPKVVADDGPIGRYRAWCRQFYPLEAV